MRGEKIKLHQSWKTLNGGERKDLFRLLRILGGIVVLLVLLYYGAINGIPYIGSFWALFTGNRTETQKDTTPPPSPSFSPLSSYTKTKTIKVSGFAEPASEVTLSVNGDKDGKTITEAGGTFNFSDVTLPTQGRNVITAVAADPSGNVSQKSAELIITLDTKPPEIKVSSPKDGQSFVGENKQISVKGKTEAGATVKVNETQATVLADGTFKTTITANTPGNIKITIIATDKAGNEKTVELTVTYSAQ